MREIIAAATILVVQPCERPPVQYQGVPPDPFTVAILSPEAVDARCREIVPKMATDPRQILACAQPGPRILTMPDPCLYEGDPYADLLCHEVSHLNGWRHG